jgi:hypothetical protein
MAATAREQGLRRVFVPDGDAAEAALIPWAGGYFQYSTLRHF